MVYMRGVATGSDGNHTGSLPSVGFYLDEQPVTTIGGTLDVHIYDIARIESLAGPQGTLYGASSEAGTIRIITNKPEFGVTAGRVDGELNRVAHGGMGGKLEGMINLPIAPASRSARAPSTSMTRATSTMSSASAPIAATPIFGPDPDPARQYHRLRPQWLPRRQCAFVKKNFNDQQDLWRARGAEDRPGRQLDRHADDHAPEYQCRGRVLRGRCSGRPRRLQRFRKEPTCDKFTQICADGRGQDRQFRYHLCRRLHGSADVRRLSDYTDYTDAYDALTKLRAASGGIAYYYYFQNDAGDQIDPRSTSSGGNHFKKMSQELRIASPADKPFRVIGGAFYQHQSNDILQEYTVDNLGPMIVGQRVPGH